MTAEDVLNSRAQGRVGTVLRSKYTIDRVIGAGGMAVVYKVTHRNRAEFAVKMLHPELSAREEIRTRFLREGYAANSVKHPGAVLVVDDDVAEDGAAFLVMELLHGLPIDVLWRRAGSRLSLRAVLATGDQLLDVLAAAHERGIVHRDIKPPNLFVTEDGTLKVLDFGIARVKDLTGLPGSDQQTGTGVLLGTPAYMAPEQAYAKAHDIDGQTDIWTVGATLFTLLTGLPVHEGENIAQLMIHAATKQARSLASVAPDVPAPVVAVIDKALALDKAERWATAQAMREALEAASVEAIGEKPPRSALLALVKDAQQADAELAQVTLGTLDPRPTPVTAALTPPVFHAAAKAPGLRDSHPSGALVPTSPGAPISTTSASATAGAIRSTTAEPRSVATQPSPLPLLSGETTQPVSSDPVVDPPPRGGARARLGAVGLVIVAMFAGGGLVLLRDSMTAREAPAAAVASPTPPPPAPPAALSAPAAAAETVAASAPPPPAPPTSTSAEPAPVAAPSAAPEGHPRAARPPPARCDPPTWTDDKGHVHLKKGCD